MIFEKAINELKEIKEKLLKRIEIFPFIQEDMQTYTERFMDIVIEETSKAKDEEFIKILEKIQIRIAEEVLDFKEHHTITRSLSPDYFTYYIEEIKQKLEGGK